MTKMASARRSNFGMRCAHCNDHPMAPEWTEQRNNRQIIMFGTAQGATFISRPSSTPR